MPLPFVLISAITLFAFVAIPLFAYFAHKASVKTQNLEFLKDKQWSTLEEHGAIVINPSLVDMGQVSSALADFVREYQKEFPLNWFYRLLKVHNISKMSSRLVIEFRPGEYFLEVKDVSGREHPKPRKLAGQMVNKHYMIVATGTDGRQESIGNSAFVHELNHWALGVTGKDWAPTHEQPPWTPEHYALESNINSNYR
jgi:hypothetical protein